MTGLNDGLFVGGNDSYLSGAGQTRAQTSYSAETAADVTAGNYQTETVNVEYDSVGRATRQSQPYRAGETPVWSLIRYDWAGRPDRITAPDGSVSQTFYDERTYPGAATHQHGMTVRSVDAWGRERWARTGALGRMVEVLEPNPNGGGTVTEAGALRTEYVYDTLNQITKIIQGVQTRWFLHDSLGRLTHQKLAEQEGTIHETSGDWSSKFEYDTHSNLIKQTDARGVVTKSSDPNGTITAYNWNFGDGTTATGATPSKSYSAAGTFTVILTVTDNQGATNSATTTATISSPPPPPPGGTLTDGATSLSYDIISNRISTAGYQYDSAGNLTRGQAESGVWQRYQYDAANRLVAVMNDSSVVIVTNSYGSDNGKLKSVENGVTRWYGWDGGQSIIEYSDNGTNLVWAKSYVYLGGRLLLTDEPVTGRQYHHADRLGTRIVTNASGAKLSEQATLPFGTALGSPETTGTPTNRRFTSYERSSATKLDYAVNRSYASWQGRFTQVDPLGMGAVSVGNPQSLNLYGYVENDPVNFVDPNGLNRQNCQLVTIFVSGYDLKENVYYFDRPINIIWCTDVPDPWWIDSRNHPKPFGVDGNIGPSPETREKLVDGFQTVLDIAGFCPGLGELADGASGLISAIRGDANGAALSAAAMVPFAGWGATGGKFAKKAVSLSMDEAIEQGVKHVGSDGIMEITGRGTNYQFRSTVTNAVGEIETRVARFDVNPLDPHVQQLGPHLNLETRIGKKKVGKDPHTPINPATVRKGDCPK